ncbi:hypothetical protein Natpe_0508 [Natrinema pellirubrum DSM 15624]|uniref:Uncharacterized protein n=1 Tax=Natrinema pellirubrum (strain DSM 15624 / CIP 106293 / JCM 10476 / NCIMB 786 / 157) TaxID=797303 RepID=L0JIP9_NATP1|nr:hypothetical protein Natpe_0508 [Natrinema pellirubrum DSM 15624]
MRKLLKSRVFTTNWDAWNNKWAPIVAAPFLAVLGVVIGTVLGIHFTSSELGQTLVMGLFLFVTMMAGFTLLALVD